MQAQKNLRLFRGEKCLNCSTPLDVSDRFCSYCGQINSIKKLAFNDFFNEFFAGLFAYDSKIYRTISALFLRPGKISEDYVTGKRNRYVNPFRFYLSVSIIFFILFSFTKTGEDDSFGLASVEPSTVSDTESTSPNEKVASYKSEEELEKLPVIESYVEKTEVYYHFYLKEKTENPEEALKLLNHANTKMNQWLYLKAQSVYRISQDPTIFYNYFISKLPFIIFFYLPIFALFIWLLYIRRPFSYMEHIIFIFHNQTMLFLLFTLAQIFEIMSGREAAMGLASMAFLFYLYKAMRRFYKQGRFKTILKFTVLNGIFIILAGFAGLFALFASLAMY